MKVSHGSMPLRDIWLFEDANGIKTRFAFSPEIPHSDHPVGVGVYVLNDITESYMLLHSSEWYRETPNGSQMSLTQFAGITEGYLFAPEPSGNQLATETEHPDIYTISYDDYLIPLYKQGEPPMFLALYAVRSPVPRSYAPRVSQLTDSRVISFYLINNNS